MDGHDWDSVYQTLRGAMAVEGRPSMVIAHTIKGKGNKAVEGRPESHNVKVPDKAAYEKYMSGLEQKELVLPY